MSRTKWLLAILSLIVAGVLLLLPPGDAPPATSEIVAESIALHGYSPSGSIEWEIRAIAGALEDEKGRLRNAEIRFFDEEGIPLSITGEELLRTREESLMSGPVRIEQENGFVLETVDLLWSESLETLRAGAVRLNDDGVQLEAEAFSYDLSSHAAKFEGSLVATFEGGMLEAAMGSWDKDGFTFSGVVALHVDLSRWEALDGS